MKNVLMVAAVALLAASPVWAGSLEPAHVSADAKWLFHLDFDAAKQTTFADRFREERLDEPRVQKAFDWVEDRYGIKIGQDLHGVTAYGMSYEPHQGVVLLLADYDRQKVEAVLKDEPGFETGKYRDYTLYSWTVYEEGDRKEEDDGGEKQGYRATAAFAAPDIVVLGRPEESVKEALDVLDGEQPSLKGKDSYLVGNVPEGTVFRGAAIDLAGLEQRDRPLPVLTHGERMRLVAGEKEGQAFLTSHFVAESAEAAKKVKEMLEGLKATLELRAEENERAAELAKGLEFKVDDRMVTVEARADSQELMRMAEETRRKRAEGRRQR